jgi:hypothetical protein
VPFTLPPRLVVAAAVVRTGPWLEVTGLGRGQEVWRTPMNVVRGPRQWPPRHRGSLPPSSVAVGFSSCWHLIQRRRGWHVRGRRA